LEAARGNRDGAAEYFSLGTETIECEQYPIIRFIKMTIYAEAYRSLKDEKYAISALEIAEFLSPIYKDVQKWIDFLKNNSSNFPGNNFWY
jgi:hypothetical protein